MCKGAIHCMVALVFFIIFLCFTSNASTEVCEGCANPLVEVRPIQFGDVPASWANYNYSGNGEERAYEYLDFRARNPCADIKFVQDKYPLDDTEFGPWGDAEYFVETSLKFVKADANSLTLVWIGGGWDGKHFRTREPKLVPTLGHFIMKNELRSFKNNQIYDSEEVSYDCIDRLPDDTEYVLNKESTVINGRMYSPPDDYMEGDFEPPKAVIDALKIEFPKSDIGLTIRKKETPSAARIDIDKSSAFPPFYLIKVDELLNQFNEPIPDKIPVALRVDKGEIDDGQPLEDCRVFITKNGGLSGPIRYRPPKCSQSPQKVAIEIRDICHWNKLSQITRETRVRKTVDLPACNKLNVDIKGSFHWAESSKDQTQKMDARFTISGTMIMKSRSRDGFREKYQIERMNFHFKVSAQFFSKDGELELDAAADKTIPLTKGEVEILSEPPNNPQRDGKPGWLFFSFQPDPIQGKVIVDGEEMPHPFNAFAVMEILVVESPRIALDQTVVSGSRSYGLKEWGLEFPGMNILPFFSDTFALKTPAGQAMLTPGGSNVTLSWTLTKVKAE